MKLAKTIHGEQVRCKYPKTFMLMKGQTIESVKPEGDRWCVTAIISGERCEVVVQNKPEIA